MRVPAIYFHDTYQCLGVLVCGKVFEKIEIEQRWIDDCKCPSCENILTFVPATIDE